MILKFRFALQEGKGLKALKDFLLRVFFLIEPINALCNKHNKYHSVGAWVTPFITNICCNNIKQFLLIMHFLTISAIIS
jgi:hypothetical protein